MENKKELNAYLSPIAAKQLANVVYSLDYGEGESTTEQDAINHIIEEHAMYEEIMEDQLTRWLMDEYPKKYREWQEKNKKDCWKH